jgi:hypothetical protein
MNPAFANWKPAIPRRWLLVIAGGIWSLVAIVLFRRALGWVSGFDLSLSLPMELAGLALAAIGYRFGFSAVVEKNIVRIQGLPERACAFAFTPWRGYGMIGLMVTAGLLLRGSDLPKYLLSIPYTAMGGSLVLGSVRLLRQFAATKPGQ